MSNNHFVTILGRSCYIPCNYDEFENCKFIQEALIRKYIDELDRVSVFATKESIEANWKELKNNIESIREQNNANFRFSKKESLHEIPKGYSEEEIWQIFNIILAEIKNEENIFLDITHGFRYQPMLVMNILNYAKAAKNIEVKKVNYGLFEILTEIIGDRDKVKESPMEDRNAEILDLTVFDYLNDLVIEVDNFLATGDAEKISSVTEKEKEKKYRSGEKDEISYFFNKISKLGKKLHYFNQELKTARGNNLHLRIQEILNTLNSIEEIKRKTNKIAPFVNLIDNIENKFSRFKLGKEEEIMLENYFILLDWCKEHNLVQQGFIILRENIISFIAYKLELPFLPEHMNSKEKYEYKLKDYREEISSIISHKTKNDTLDEEYDEKTDKILAEKIESFLDDNFSKEFFDAYEDVRVKRNDVCHFGLNEDSTTKNADIIEAFSEHVEYFSNLLFKENNN